ncbi:MAG: RecQ family ATP-dependent DNA helicase [Prevotella sp.]|nr:RecQ family ATP-dependent DNA helicase [Prevotella sp.]MDY5666382.1 ATP-dependent DNA helicase RecQ [Alloprevotella sp.]
MSYTLSNDNSINRNTPATPGGSVAANALRILKQYWGYADFRGIQQQIIESIMARHDTLGLMPTGGGKSITFQVPALATEGVCLVVTPLIALMKDQVDNLRRHGIPAAAIYSGQSRNEIIQHLDNAIFGAYKFLYVSPERLSTSIFMNKVQRMKVNIITVDEAHCISQWGYDFRPHYLRIAEVRKLLPDVPVLALTATATHAVIDDIQQRLAFRPGAKVYKMSFARPNLHYMVRAVGNPDEQLLHILNHVEGSAIVYTRSRRGTRDVAELLNDNNITALYYHAGLSSLEKDTRQRAWQEGRVRVMVATNAFGMGIDKPDVRLVVHMDVPDSIEAYFQEAGRGGRDGKVAYAVLLTQRYDATKMRLRVGQMFPERDYIRRVYSELASFFQVAEGEGEGNTFDFDIERFCRVFKHFPTNLVSALHLLTRAGYIHFDMEGDNTARMMFLVTREDLYHIHYIDNDEERLLNAIMRNAGGYFADYVPLDEEELANICGFTHDEVYNKLKHLSKLRVISYVPRKSTPQITYTQRRIDSDYVVIPRDIYEVQRDMYQQRVEAMVRYISETDTCRSRFLLHYFDDEGPDCGYCDVCINRDGYIRSLNNEQQVEAAVRYISHFLSDGNLHSVNDFANSGFDRETLKAALHQLIERDEIKLGNGGGIRMSSSDS